MASRDGAMSGGAHLRLEERERLAALKGEGLSLRAMARQLGRAASTISRELRRNALPKGGYLPAHAEGCYLERRQRPALVERDAKLGRFVRERLLEGWTPEQIAGWLKRGEDGGLRRVCTDALHAAVRPPHRKERRPASCCRVGGRGGGAVGLASRAASLPSGAPSTTGPRPSRSARKPGTGGARSWSASATRQCVAPS